METQYKITESGIKEIRNKSLMKSIPLALLAMAAGLGMSMYNSDDPAGDTTFLLFVVPILLIILFFGLRKGINRQLEILKSYTLTFADGKVLRQQNDTPDIEIAIREIKEIIKQKNGAFAIKGENLNNTIAIPAEIERVDELEMKLAEIREIKTQDSQSFFQKFQWPVTLAVLGLMAIVYLGENKLLVGLAGITLTGFLIYSLVVTEKSKHVDSKTKKSMWVVLILIFSVIVSTFIKVFGLFQ